MKKTHKCKDGTIISIKDMTDSHLDSMIDLIKRKSEEGITVQSGGGACAEDIYYDEWEIKGKQVEDFFDLKAYTNEKRKRNDESK